MAYYEEDKNFRPVFSTALSLMQTRGNDKYCQLIQRAEVSVVNSDYDNWNGGTYGYTVYLNLPVKVYASLSKEEVEEAEKELATSLNEAIKGDENSYFNTQIAPRFTQSDINWEQIGGESGKIQLRDELNAIKDLMISVATGGPKIQSVEARYKSLQASIAPQCKLLNITYNNSFSSLWDWYARWSNEMPHYQERRQFVNDLFAPTFEAFSNDGTSPSIATPIVELCDWERINRTVEKIKQNSTTAKNEEDFQQVGLLCRDVIISLAQAVYDPEIYGATDEEGKPIGKDDAMRMIGNYLNVCLTGSSNGELRAYAKATNKLANSLTHGRNATKKEMMLCVSATIALINFIGILEDKV